MNDNRPIGITRTLPYDPKSAKHSLRVAYKRLMTSLRALNTDDEAQFYVGMSGMPRHDILYIYLIASGHVVGRANIAAYLTEQPPMMRLDQTVYQHKVWCVLSGPFIEPPEKLKRRGHQGIRYVFEELW